MAFIIHDIKSVPKIIKRIKYVNIILKNKERIIKCQIKL